MSRISPIASLAVVGLRYMVIRPGPALVMALSVGCTVGVFAAALAVAEGVERRFSAAAEDSRGLILSTGSPRELTSVLLPEEVTATRNLLPHARLSAETVMTFPRLKMRDGTLHRMMVRGVTDAAFAIRPEVEVVHGRWFKQGLREITVGVGAAWAFDGLRIGDTVAHHDVPSVEWTVVGHFAAAGGFHESEVWADKDVLSVYRGGSAAANAIWFQVRTPDETTTIGRTLAESPAVPARVMTESEAFRYHSELLTKPLRTLARVVVGIMAIGAVAAALYAAYSVVNVRRTEFAVLKTVGFGTGHLATAMIAEMTAPAAVGGAIGLGTVYAAADGVRMIGGGWTRFAFDIALTPTVGAVALALAMALSMVAIVMSSALVAHLNTAAALSRA